MRPTMSTTVSELGLEDTRERIASHQCLGQHLNLAAPGELGGARLSVGVRGLLSKSTERNERAYHVDAHFDGADCSESWRR